MKYLINSPNISKKESTYVMDVLKSTWLSSNGHHTKIFEQKFSKTVNRKYSLAVQSGTAALHLVLKSIGCGNKDNVVIPNFTCVSNISSVVQCGSMPIIIEVERDTLGIDVSLLEKTIKKYKPKALQLVHVYGHPARDTLKILKLCKKYKICLIEDASEALGAQIGTKKIGSLGDVSVFSTRSEKMVGVGEGAIISTDSKVLFEKICLLASRNAPFRRRKDPYWKKYYSDGEGYNYLMPHLLGAVGRAQIEKFKNDTLIKKRKVGSYYRKIFNEKNFYSTQMIIKGNKPVYWLNSVYFKKLNKNEVIRLAMHLQTKGIEVRSGFWPMSHLKKFNSKYIRGEKKVSMEIFEKSLVLPSNTNLKERDIKYFFNLIKNYLDK
jgi:perosamine synthetase